MYEYNGHDRNMPMGRNNQLLSIAVIQLDGIGTLSICFRCGCDAHAENQFYSNSSFEVE
jgi:hypothetical protein